MAKIVNTPNKIEKNDICRTCLNESDVLLPIFHEISVSGDNITVNELLMKCATVQVKIVLTCFIQK